MVKRDPSPRKGNFMSRRGFVEVGAKLGLLAALGGGLAACNTGEQGPTPAPTTSSADKTPGATATASATETTKDMFPASPSKLSEGRQYHELTPQQKSLIDRLDALEFSEFIKQPENEQFIYGQLVVDTYHDYAMDRMTNSLANTTEIQDFTTFEPIPLSKTNTPDRVLYELEKTRGIINWSLTAEGSSVPLESRRNTADKALASLYKYHSGDAFSIALKNSRGVTDLEQSDGFVSSVATNFRETTSPEGAPRVTVDRLYNGVTSSYVFDFSSLPDASGKLRPRWLVVNK